jgi:hypothetical protein
MTHVQSCSYDINPCTIAFFARTFSMPFRHTRSHAVVNKICYRLSASIKQENRLPFAACLAPWACSAMRLPMPVPGNWPRMRVSYYDNLFMPVFFAPHSHNGKTNGPVHTLINCGQWSSPFRSDSSSTSTGRSRSCLHAWHGLPCTAIAKLFLPVWTTKVPPVSSSAIPLQMTHFCSKDEKF